MKVYLIVLVQQERHMLMLAEDFSIFATSNIQGISSSFEEVIALIESEDFNKLHEAMEILEDLNATVCECELTPEELSQYFLSEKAVGMPFLRLRFSGFAEVKPEFTQKYRFKSLGEIITAEGIYRLSGEVPPGYPIEDVTGKRKAGREYTDFEEIN